RKNCPLLCTAKRQERPVRGDLERAKDAEIEVVRASERSAPAGRLQGEVRVGPGRPAPHVTRCQAGRQLVGASAQAEALSHGPAEPLVEAVSKDGMTPAIDQDLF